jgi:hypothetical protein
MNAEVKAALAPRRAIETVTRILMVDQRLSAHRAGFRWGDARGFWIFLRPLWADGSPRRVYSASRY